MKPVAWRRWCANDKVPQWVYYSTFPNNFKSAEPLYPPSAWESIETAPKGRKLIVGYHNPLGNWRTVLAHYWVTDTLESDHTETGFADEGWYEATEAYEELAPLDCEPTHWQPLPEPPTLLYDRAAEGKGQVLRCPKCGVDRLKEACPSNMNCPLVGSP